MSGSSNNPQPYIDPKQQEGTTPLVKLMAGKATRDFRNYRQPPVSDADYTGPRSIIDGQFKLVMQELGNGDPKIELFDLEFDPAETTNLSSEQPDVANRLRTQLREWQDSVLHSLTGADYPQ